jgi:hypothetical protein
VSGTLVAEGHSLSPSQVVSYFDDVDEITLDMQADGWPGLPQRLRDLEEPKPPQTFTCITCGRRAVVPYGGSFQCRECGSTE